MALAWEEIMSKSPTMKALIESKITEEVGKNQVEVDNLRAEIEELKALMLPRPSLETVSIP